MKSGEIKISTNDPKHVEISTDRTATTRGSELPEILRQYTASELKAMEKSIVRRLDIRTLPILVILFIVNILDRNTIANARLGGLEAELGMSDKQYQTALMVLWGMSSIGGKIRWKALTGFDSWIHLDDDSL